MTGSLARFLADINSQTFRCRIHQAQCSLYVQCQYLRSEPMDLQILWVDFDFNSSVALEVLIHIIIINDW